MKNFIVLTVISFLISFFSFSLDAQYDTLRVEFGVSEYSLDTQIAVPHGKVIKVIGMANSLPNSNGMSNDKLAQLRAESFNFSDAIQHEAIVFNSNSARYRAVLVIVDTSIDEDEIVKLETQFNDWAKFKQQSQARQNQLGVTMADSAMHALNNTIRRAIKGYDVTVPIHGAPTPQVNKIKIKTVGPDQSNSLDTITPKSIPCACEVMSGMSSAELRALADKNLKLARETGDDRYFKRAKLAKRQSYAQRKAERKAKKHKPSFGGGSSKPRGNGHGDWTNGNILYKVFPMLSCRK